MADKPIIFAMANPDPEITAEEVAEVRDDAIMATGRSDYPNQVNNVLGFPYIFRGALDVRATTINMEMKIAAAHALAELAREDVPDEVAAAYQGTRPKFGPDYIIPVPFDPRLISHVPPAVAKAAMDTGVARKPIADMEAYRQHAAARRDPIAGVLQRVFQRLRRAPKRVVFAEGEEEQVIRAAASFVHQGLGTAILVGREEPVRQSAQDARHRARPGHRDHQRALSTRNADYADYLYERLQRKGYLFRDCQRLINQDRNTFAACMVALGDADAMVTGVTRNYSVALEDVRRVIDPKPGHRVIGLSLVLARGRTGADRRHRDHGHAEGGGTRRHRRRGGRRRPPHGLRAARGDAGLLDLRPSAGRALGACDRGGEDPRPAPASISNTTARWRPTWRSIPEAAAPYPFFRLTGPANVLIMPAFHSASISTKLLQELGGATVIGPLLVGLDRPVQIVPLGAKDSQLVNMAALAAFNVSG